MTIAHALTSLSDAALLAEVKRLVAQERTATARLIESLMELDARRLYLAEGCSSLFTYCTSVLHLSEHAAFGPHRGGAGARRLPALLDRLLDGSVTVTNARTQRPISPSVVATRPGPPTQRRLRNSRTMSGQPSQRQRSSDPP